MSAGVGMLPFIMRALCHIPFDVWSIRVCGSARLTEVTETASTPLARLAVMLVCEGKTVELDSVGDYGSVPISMRSVGTVDELVYDDEAEAKTGASNIVGDEKTYDKLSTSYFISSQQGRKCMVLMRFVRQTCPTFESARARSDKDQNREQSSTKLFLQLPSIAHWWLLYPCRFRS